jgi:6-pyruvoyl-tetrahydropterin synthase
MQSVIWVQINFDAAHAPSGWTCRDTSGLHGHRYMIRAYRSEPLVEGRDHKQDDLRSAMFALREELQGTIIDHLLPGVSTHPLGIATWVLERIPMTTAIRVSTEAHEAVEVHR